MEGENYKSYQKKYLKYKNKYSSLKRMHGGAVLTDAEKSACYNIARRNALQVLFYDSQDAGWNVVPLSDAKEEALLSETLPRYRREQEQWLEKKNAIEQAEKQAEEQARTRARIQAHGQAVLAPLLAEVDRTYRIAHVSGNDAKVADYHKALRKYQETLRELRSNGYN